MEHQSQKQQDSGKERAHAAKKVPYRKPEFVKLGSLTDLTLNTSGGTKLDGGPASKHTPGRGGRGGNDNR